MCFLAYIEPTKRCTLCQQSKSWDDFARDSRRQDSLESQCRNCRNLRQRATYKRHQKQRVLTKRQSRITQRDVITAQRRALYAQDPERFREQKRQQYARDPEKLRNQCRRSRTKHAAQRRLGTRQRYAANKHWWINWRAANAATVRLISSRRRARKRALPDTFTLAERVFMLDYWHHACAVCGNQEGFFWQLADDHWIPLAHPDSPGTIATNMVPLCHGDGGCNNSKRDMLPLTWLCSRFTPAQAKRIMQAIETYFAVVRTRQMAAD